MTTRAKNPATARRNRVFMVELKVNMPDTPRVTFFGSKKAMFEYFGNKALGITYSYSHNINFAKNPYENHICCIYEGIIITPDCIDVIERREREGREEMARGKWGETKKKEE